MLGERAIPGGQTFEVADDLADELLAGEVHLTEVTPEAETGEGSTTEEDITNG